MNPWNDPARTPDERADALLAELTLEEKVGQLGSFCPVARQATEISGDVAPMENALGAQLTWEEATENGLGHLTRNYGVEPVDVPEALRRLRDYQAKVVEASRFGIPALVHEECLTGFTTLGATMYPAAIAWGATFDPELVKEMAYAIGSDMHAVGVHQGLSPLLDVVRDYRVGSGRGDVRRGPVRRRDARYRLRPGPPGGRCHRDAQTLRRILGEQGGAQSRAGADGAARVRGLSAAPFEMAVRVGKTGSVMNSYSDIDGMPAGASVDLLTTTLRDRWGFDGTVVSDYWSVIFLQMMHKVAATPAQAGALALTAGLDIELPNTGCYQHLVEEVRSGRLDEALVDRAARRILRQKVELGLLDPDFDPAVQGQDRDLDSAPNRAIALKMAEQSIVLLRNDGLLPLAAGDKAPGQIALIGPCGDEARTFMGCYSYPNHVLNKYPELGMGIESASFAAALAQEFARSEVVVEQGVPVLQPDRSGFDAAVQAAHDADVAVLAVGDLAGLFGLGTSGEGCDSVDLTLPGLQAELVEAVLATGTPTVLVVISGRPYSLGGFADRCAAVIQAFMPGEEGGAALAGVLSGRVNPTGKLPIGLPDHPGGQPGTYLAAPLAWHSEGVSNLDPRPLFPFGFGTSYTSFSVSDLQVSEQEIPSDGTVEVSATVTNTGDREGAEVVQLYLGDVVAQVVRPIKQLVGYAKVWLAPGESQRVTFELHADRTSFTGIDYRRIVEPGEFRLLVGTSSEDLPLEGTVTITGDVRVVPEGHVLTTPVRVG